MELICWRRTSQNDAVTSVVRTGTDQGRGQLKAIASNNTQEVLLPANTHRRAGIALDLPVPEECRKEDIPQLARRLESVPHAGSFAKEFEQVGA